MSHSAALSGDDFSGAAVFKPTVAASIWKTFGVLTSVMYFGAWLISLPAELILHRRVGKRYMNSFFFACSIVLLSALTGGLIRMCLPGPINTRLIHNPGELPRPITDAAMLLGAFLISSLVAFAVHKFANRRRFGTPDQGHSFDNGIPHLAYAPFDRAGAKFLLDQMPPEPAPSSDASVMEMESYPLAVLNRFSGHIRHHLSALAQGVSPYGPVTWLIIAIVEPALLGAFGLIQLRLCGLATPLGWYMLLLAAALFFKALMHRADWLEKAYTDVDQRLEADAMKQWRTGKPATAFSSVFTVPISEAVLPRACGKIGPLVGETLFDNDGISGTVGSDGSVEPHDADVPRPLLWEKTGTPEGNRPL